MTSPTAPAVDLTEIAAALRLGVGRLSRRMRQESSLGLSLTQIGILATLDLRGPTTLGDLATAEKVAPPTITKAVADLARTGLVEKVPDPDDRRVCRAVLTATGRRDVQRMRRRREEWLASRLAELSPADAARLAAIVPLLDQLSRDDP